MVSGHLISRYYKTKDILFKYSLTAFYSICTACYMCVCKYVREFIYLCEYIYIYISQHIGNEISVYLFHIDSAQIFCSKCEIFIVNETFEGLVRSSFMVKM